ncbi:MAG: hypothetical protein Harvfovirus19_12 [Harvfovirus sp.]|uniref:Uncharacterized protein n=1 Tax=Harvfovirus sp. TaxID=2487768 RepID=A0A3G5A1S2_9VIRU|nr:MAG: hypothetical protein Harvfovirus19_12 [Harvfovirus sp.]
MDRKEIKTVSFHELSEEELDRLEAEEKKSHDALIAGETRLETAPAIPENIAVIDPVLRIYGMRTAASIKEIKAIQEFIRLHQKNDWTSSFHKIGFTGLTVDGYPMTVSYLEFELLPGARLTGRADIPKNRIVCVPCGTFLTKDPLDLTVIDPKDLLEVVPKVPPGLAVIDPSALVYGYSTPCSIKDIITVYEFALQHQKNNWTLHFKEISTTTPGGLYQELILTPPRRPGVPIHRILCFPYATFTN